jgi:hypothetical protein
MGYTGFSSLTKTAINNANIANPDNNNAHPNMSAQVGIPLGTVSAIYGGHETIIRE